LLTNLFYYTTYKSIKKLLTSCSKVRYTTYKHKNIKGGEMFGSDDNQQYGVPTGAPVNNDDIMQNGSLEQNETVADVHQPNDGAVPHSDPGSVFPPAGDNSDPFGTAQSVQSAPVSDDAAVPTAHHQDAPETTADSNLLDIKQQALQHLSPLVQHLDQSAEEKFKTTMMMIQASDDKSLVPAAFESAKQIQDDKARAQALLDIINEINYFTQQ
jgi:hypothetical protein